MTAVSFVDEYGHDPALDPGWRLSPKARERIEAGPYTVDQVVLAAQLPVTDRDSDPDLYPGTRLFTGRDGCRVVVRPWSREIVTVLDPAVGPYVPDSAPPPSPLPPLERAVSEQEVKALSSRVRNGRKPATREDLPKEKVTIEGPKNCRFEFIAELPEQRRGVAAAQEHWIEQVLPQLHDSPGAWAQIMEFPSPSTAQGRIKGLRERYSAYEWAGRRWGRKAGEPGARSAIYVRKPVQA